ncbi:hydrogen peroxide resistance inhibitor IprA [Salmonella bongori]|uniref:Inhibitor of hydrogen peroxide resistance n=1 Tax=Salmonella bongori TaxID=54736 RepID=A0A8F8FMZ0_SALBN|nr:hydrogen peroxide resistance inhibitor IprA [Salmonella bongori]QXY84594.1 hydrogen peroxide resistance inhibitor IprA [Salmonella bongori]
MLSLSKPLQEFSILDKYLSKQGARFEFVNDKEIICSSEESNTHTFVILDGVVSLIRGDKVLIGIVQAPFIFGLADGLAKKESQYKLIAESGCIGYRLASSQTLSIIEQHQLWREAFCWLAWKNQVLELRDRQLIGNNSYDQIRATLITMIKWDEELRSRIGVMNYIHQRTRVSRSVVAEVLAALRKGNYIEMNKGKLVSINRLPSEY